MNGKIAIPLFLLLGSCVFAQEQSSLRGRVVDAVTGKPLEHAHLRLVAGGFNSSEISSVVYGAISDTEGHFSIRVLRATVGKQRVRITGTPGNVYVKSMWLGTTEMADRELDLRSDLTGEQLILLFSMAGAQVSGIAQSRSDALSGADI
jgi:hypothetical protein